MAPLDPEPLDYIRAGAALFNTGHYLAAHEPWEERWLDASAGDRDDCLQGLIQATAAVYKSKIENRSGAKGLANSAQEYLDGTSVRDANVDTGELSAWLARLEADPGLGTREHPPRLRVDGTVVTPSNLAFPAAGLAVEAVAETRDDEIVERALAYAQADLAAGRPTSPFVTLTLDYLRDDENDIIRTRLAQHVERRAAKDEDVAGLFE